MIGLLGEEGTDMSRVIFGHSDPIASDLDLMLELLDHGVYIQFDLLGRVGARRCDMRRTATTSSRSRPAPERLRWRTQYPGS